MKVRLTEMRYMGNRRCYPGDIMEWPEDMPLGRGVEALEAPEQDEVPLSSPSKRRAQTFEKQVL